MPRSWSFPDFLLIWLAGLVGATVFLLPLAGSETLDWAVVVALVGQYVGTLGLYFWLARRRDQTIDLSIRGSDFGYIGLGLLFQILLMILFIPLSSALFPDGGRVQQTAEILAEADSLAFQLVLVVGAVVVGPAVEEILYRNVLLTALEGIGRRVAMIGSAAVFAAVHITGLDFDRFWASAAVVLPPLFILGVVLAWLVLRDRRLGPALMFHSGWNLLAALLILIPPELLEQPAN